MTQSSCSITRRAAIAQMGVVALNVPILQAAFHTKRKRPQKVLLRSSWQTVNIGDIAHTPGVLKLLETYLPDVEIYLWFSKLDNGVEELLLKRFPKLKIVKGKDALISAFKECDFLLHSSGPSLVAEKDVIRWTQITGKPYGIYGITLPQPASSKATPNAKMKQTIQVLSKANFVFFRDTVSMKFAKEQGCTSPVMEFAPDGAFACDLRDDKKANKFLRENRLEAGKFLCCIPRLRYTPYWTLSKKRPLNKVRHARNEQMKEHDHAELRQAIIEVVKQTDRKILICPEDETQMKVGKELLYDQLSSDIKKQVVWRPNYWLTGEAISTYVQSAGLFGNEMHSPIMCIGNGIPAIVCRWKEQTSKGIMWNDIGLDDWLFDMDDEQQVKGIVPAVLAIAQKTEAAKKKVLHALKFVHQRQRETMGQLVAELGKTK
ncbi:hypothetical protein MNBD_PLANCTO02-1740 [hydrothermal vent metagenome]|uniref:Polysaccharide pyruvyl transferase domain-containing protein n=1 Tax=hydrothermal vent metagenome TaxID=652676 RepID=A0A3B1D867_9ZZZZ